VEENYSGKSQGSEYGCGRQPVKPHF